MTLPGFTAAQALHAGRSAYRRAHTAHHSGAGDVVPAIPFCGNCDEILERCELNGWRPRAVCTACALGNCYSGVEVPPPRNPWE